MLTKDYMGIYEERLERNVPKGIGRSRNQDDNMLAAVQALGIVLADIAGTLFDIKDKIPSDD